MSDRWMIERDTEVRRQALEDAARFLEAIGHRGPADCVREMKYNPVEHEVRADRSE